MRSVFSVALVLAIVSFHRLSLADLLSADIRHSRFVQNGHEEILKMLLELVDI